MEPATWRGVKADIKHLFGRPLRVLLATWLATCEDDHVYLLQVQTALLPFGVAPSGVSEELREFVAQRMLDEVHDGRRVYFIRRESPLWAAYAAIAAAFGLAEEAAVERPSELPRE